MTLTSDSNALCECLTAFEKIKKAPDMFVNSVSFESVLTFVNGILYACGKIDGKNYIRELGFWLSDKKGTDAAHPWQYQVLVAFYAADNRDIKSVINNSRKDSRQLELIETAMDFLADFISKICPQKNLPANHSQQRAK